MSTTRGALIVLEGVDRSGKTTQCKNLVEWLSKSGKKAKYINFPDRSTDCGSLIDKFLTNNQEFNDETIHLLFSLNRWESKSKMEKLLKEGITLVVDRYSYSGVAYSAAKGLSYDWCKNPEVGLLKPDLVLYLTLTCEAMLSRKGFGNERYENKEFQKKVRECFEKLYDSSYWQNVDANRSEMDLTQVLAKYADETILSMSNKPLKLLW
ncbi:Thymidylate kinase [Pseudolycoriella hygida]|uniref:Thymidylate kinase n=1 Tax=Pseudolycoriella hygida TaxID=35572 RepID=A0A9Q0S1K3_9DIPT|nr:Thymidylate kinase [Pseudolycoriella hygida]